MALRSRYSTVICRYLRLLFARLFHDRINFYYAMIIVELSYSSLDLRGEYNKTTLRIIQAKFFMAWLHIFIFLKIRFREIRNRNTRIPGWETHLSTSTISSVIYIVSRSRVHRGYATIFNSRSFTRGLRVTIVYPRLLLKRDRCLSNTSVTTVIFVKSIRNFC